MSKVWRVFLVTLCLVLCSNPITSAARTKVTLMTYGTPEQEVFFQQVKEGFERDNPDYELEYQLVAFADYINKMLVNLAAGTAPDVFLTWAQYKGQWADDGMLLDITDYVSKSRVYRLDRFFPVIKDNVSYQNRIYGAPWGFNTSVFWANVDLLEKNGIATPNQNWTVDDFRRLTKKIARPEQGVFGTTFQGYNGDGPYIQQMFNWAGHEYLDASQRQVLVNSEGAIRLADFWRQLTVEDRVTPNKQYARKKNAEAFSDGDLGFWYGWSSDSQRIATLQKAGVQTIRWALMRWPKAPMGQYNHAQGHIWTIPAYHPQPQKAWKLIEWLGSEACDYIWSSSQRTPPIMPIRKHWDAYNRLLPENERESSLQFIMDVLNQGYAKDMQYWPTYPQMQAIMKTQLTRLTTGEIASKEAMDVAAQQMQAVQDEYWKSKKK